MAESTPPNASPRVALFPATDKWLSLTEETRPMSPCVITADSAPQKARLSPGADGQSHTPSRTSSLMVCCSEDGDKEGLETLLSEACQSSSPSSVTSGSCGKKDDSTSPTSSKRRHIGFVDATIRAVRPVEAPVSVDTLHFSRKPTLPRLRTSMINFSGSSYALGTSPKTDITSPSSCGNLLPEEPKRLSTEQGEPDTMRDYAALLEKKFSAQCGIEGIDEKFFGSPSFKARLHRLARSKARKGLGLLKSFGNLWKKLSQS